MGLFLRLIVWLQTIQLILLIYETYTSIVIYAHYFSDEKGKFDELVEDKGVKILIDPKALMHVIGTKMDFIDDPLRYGYFNVFFLFLLLQIAISDSLSCRSEFVFMNPNSKGECGCGESFMTSTKNKGPA